MKIDRRHCLRMGIGLGVLATVAAPACATGVLRGRAERLVWRERLLTGFGTSLWLRAADASAEKADAALEDAVRTLRRLEAQMSLFDPDSAISRLNRSGRLERPAPDLLRVLQLSSRIAQRSAGRFDVSMQPLWETWSRAQREQRLPSARELASARARVDWRAVDANADRILLPAGHGLSLNGIAQGYAADVLRSQLKAAGIAHAMLDTGETAVLGQGPGGAPWRFGIEDAHRASASSAQSVTLPSGYALATSSDAHTVFTDDRVHHHILDPRTGDSPSHWSSVTVMAPSAALADGLTKVFFMLPPERVAAAARAWQVSVTLQDKAGRWHHAST